MVRLPGTEDSHIGIYRPGPLLRCFYAGCGVPLDSQHFAFGALPIRLADQGEDPAHVGAAGFIAAQLPARGWTHAGGVLGIVAL